MDKCTKPIVARVEVEEKQTVNVAMPIKGSPVISVQGKEVKRTSISVVGEIPGMDNCSGLSVYGPDYSGEANSSVSVIRNAGTPYVTTIITCLGN